jgi:D-glycero-D-manno-heptose 1,7-bisphosphate phosphatase
MPGRAAIFLDRDGTLNQLALNPANGEWESPHSAAATRLVPDLGEALGLLKSTGLPLFVVSNQPSVAKAKCSFDDLKAVHNVVAGAFAAAGVEVVQWYYCYHHPQGVVPELTKVCECRKPGTLFLRQAAAEHGIDLKSSWFIGDQDFDARCGRDAGCRTVIIENPHSAAKRGKEAPDHKAADLVEAARIVLTQGARP